MSLWMVRAGRHGEHESLALRKKVVTIGWERLGDMSDIESREELSRRLEEAYPDKGGKTLSSWAGQIWRFIREIRVGDLVALPLKSRPNVAFGRVAGPYEYKPHFPEGAGHTRPVTWQKEIPRSDIPQDLLYSFGSLLTVCRIHRNDAEERIRALLAGKRPGQPTPTPVPESEDATDEGDTDLEAFALDQIRRHVARRFKGHRLTALVAAVLRAQGYNVRISPEGPDGGVDILAGSGRLGLDAPRLAVQVKSGDTPVGAKTVRELQGAMKNFGADRGLFVAWGGYKQSVTKEEARLFFQIRLWNSDDLLREIQRHYDELPDDLQAELPLKRIFILVSSEDAEA